MSMCHWWHWASPPRRPLQPRRYSEPPSYRKGRSLEATGWYKFRPHEHYPLKTKVFAVVSLPLNLSPVLTTKSEKPSRLTSAIPSPSPKVGPGPVSEKYEDCCKGLGKTYTIPPSGVLAPGAPTTRSFPGFPSIFPTAIALPKPPALLFGSWIVCTLDKPPGPNL